MSQRTHGQLGGAPKAPVNPELLARIETMRWYRCGGYMHGELDGRRVSQHRLLWEAWHGPIPKDYVVHHLNHVKDDNRIENLEAMSRRKHAEHHSESLMSLPDDVCRYQAMRKYGVCLRCARGRTEKWYVHCPRCQKITAEQHWLRRTKKRWLLNQGDRRCPRCRTRSRCRHEAGVCDACMDRHLIRCPDFLRGRDIWQRRMLTDLENVNRSPIPIRVE
jgi:hypothetical protein